MFSLSTCWFGSRQSSGDAMVDEAIEMGFQSLELGYGLNPEALPKIIERSKKDDIAVSSLHAFTPAIEGNGGHPELFSIAATDETARQTAIDKLLQNLRLAQEIGIPLVVLHAGRINNAARHWLWVHNRIMNESDSGFFYRRRLRKMNEARDREAPSALDALSRSLDILLPEFEKSSIRLGIENLPSYDAIPTPTEMDTLAARFSNSPSFAFWFDMGHAQVMENAGYGNAISLAKKHLKLIAGVHIHDVIGPGGDHQAPGLGGIDFKSFDFLRGRALVFEISPIVQRNELIASRSFLESLWS